MAKSLFSSLWYRVAPLKPRLRSHVKIHRRHYREQLWYVLHDQVSAKNHRFTPAANFVISMMDGEREMQSIWQEAVTQLGEDAPTQDEAITLLAQLHNANVLMTDLPADSTEIFKRHTKQKKQKLKQKFMSPLSMRFPLFDPENFLNRFNFLFKPFFGWFGAVLWMLVVATGITLAALNWGPLSENVADRALAPENFLLLWLLFPIVKALHELGHGFATKVWGGEVHEMGIMLLVFMPVPYVDASSASAFTERYKRIIVAAAGMLVELFIAAIAVIFWVYAEPGLARTIAYNVILIASISTLLFNINPLLRFDGYYMLSDAIEIPNLSTRANKYVSYLTQKFAFGVKGMKSPASAKGEPSWFVFYALASYIYRLFIMVAISIFVAGKFFFIGTMLAIFAAVNMLVLPIVKGLLFVFSGAALRRTRSRAVSMTVGTLSVIALFIVLYPAPSWTNVEGVVWLPEDATIRSGSDCFVESTLVPSGEIVHEGQAVIQCENIELSNALQMAKQVMRESQIRLNNAMTEDPILVELARDEFAAAKANLQHAQSRVDELTVRALGSGRLVIPLEQDLQGQFFLKGKTLAYIIQDKNTIVRAVVSQDDIDIVRARTESIAVLKVHNTEEPFVGFIKREVPSGSLKLPNAALGTEGGGKIAVDPRDPEGLTPFEQIFQFDIELQEANSSDVYGGRVHVRFDHYREPLAKQWYRSIRQLFLGEFGV